jgi:hypothetical protein
MEFYSGKQPNLIGPVMKNTINRISKVPKMGGNTVSDKISNFMTHIYKSYIEENKIFVFLIIIMVIFLIYRYYNKKNNSETESFRNDDYNLIKDITSTQTAHLRYDTQPSFNPLHAVEKQKEPVYYPPDPLPINLPGDGFVYTRNLYENPKSYTPMNHPNYDYDNVYTNPQRAYYSGTYDTYKNARDTDIVNPLGYRNDFNTSVGSYVNRVTETNNLALTDYQTILDNMQGNLINSLKYGPQYLDAGSPEYEMEPPYAKDDLQ